MEDDGVGRSPTAAPSIISSTKQSIEDIDDVVASNTPTNHKLAPFNPTSDQAITVALRLMNLTADDVLFDIGCGDARVLQRAVQETPVRCCIGIDSDPQCAAKALLKQTERLEIRCEDVLSPEVPELIIKKSSPSSLCAGMRLREDCTVLYLYLLPQGLQQLQPLLDQLVSSTHLRAVVTYMFSIRQWTPTCVDRTSKSGAPVYLYTLPASTKAIALPLVGGS